MIIELAKARNAERRARSRAAGALRDAEHHVVGLPSPTIEAASESAARLEAFADAVEAAIEKFRGEDHEG